MNRENKTITTELVHSGNHVHVHSVKYRTPNGETGEWEMVSRKTNPKIGSAKVDAITIAPMFQDGDICLIQEYRPALGGFELGFPAGMIDDGESLEEAARRELREETGLDVIEIAFIGPPLASSSGITDELTRPVLVTCAGELSSSSHLWYEDIVPQRVSRDELRELLRDPTIVWGARAWGILYGLIAFNDQ